MVGQPIKRARMAALAARVNADMPVKKGTPKKARNVVTSLPPKVAAPRDEEVSDLGLAISGLTMGDLEDTATNKAFEELRVLSLSFAREVMALPLRPDDRNFAKVLQVKQQIAQSVFTVTARIRPADLRETEEDGVGNLLREVKAAELDKTEPTAADLLN